MKKIISFISALCLAAFLFSMSAFAAEIPEETKTEITEGAGEADKTEPGDNNGGETEKDPEEQPEKEVVSASAYFADIYRFININEKPDLSAGYVDFKFSDGSEEHVLLNDERLPEFPDTSKVGFVPYTFEIYKNTYTVNFVIVDPAFNMARFSDVPKKYWGYKTIRNVLSAGFFTGMSENEFDPRGSMTRAQFCQMIYNIYKDVPSVMKDGDDVRFNDVEENRWFYTAVSACARAGIVDGVGDGMFNPQSPIKRQEAATIMMRILLGSAALENVNVDEAVERARQNGIAALDFDQTSNYAKKAVAAALGVILFGDKEGNLNPKNNINRAECATMMSNYFFDGYNEPPVKYLIYLSPENRANPYTGVNTNESEQMYRVAELAKPMLEEMGYDVFIADVNTSIKGDAEFNRQTEAGQMGADVYVALHSDAIGGNKNSDGRYQGTKIFYNGNNKGALELSQFIYDRVSALTPTNDRGIHDDIYESMINNQTPYAEIRLPTMANLLMEVEFHDYQLYAEWIVNNAENIARCVALGIDDYFKSL